MAIVVIRGRGMRYEHQSKIFSYPSVGCWTFVS